MGNGRKARLLIVFNHGIDNPSKAIRAFQMAKIAQVKDAAVKVSLVDEGFIWSAARPVTV